MPSGNTANRALVLVEPTGRRRVTRRRFVTLLAAGGVLSGLTACAEGTARDAERGKEADLKRTSVVDDVQATRSASLLTAGTATPQPTEKPKD